jgi:hypothetical protein
LSGVFFKACGDFVFFPQSYFLKKAPTIVGAFFTSKILLEFNSVCNPKFATANFERNKFAIKVSLASKKADKQI